MRNSTVLQRELRENDDFLGRAIRYIRPYIGELLLFTLTSISIILVQEFGSEAPGLSQRGQLTVLICLIAFVVQVVVLYRRGEEAERKRLLMDRERRNRWAKEILSGVSRLPDVKTESIRKRSASMAVQKESWPFFYDPDDYLKRVCESMRDAVARIMQHEADHVEADYVDVSLIYSVCSDGHWHWPAGRSGASAAVDMDEFVRDESTLYYHILSKKEESPIFCNDKSSCGFYHLGRRDRLYGTDGSFYATLATFASEGGPLVEAVLIISTYGVKFSDPRLGEAGEREFERNLALEVLPYYLSIIQSELAAIYIRHKWESAQVLGVTQ